MIVDYSLNRKHTKYGKYRIYDNILLFTEEVVQAEKT